MAHLQYTQPLVAIGVHTAADNFLLGHTYSSPPETPAPMMVSDASVIIDTGQQQVWDWMNPQAGCRITHAARCAGGQGFQAEFGWQGTSDLGAWLAVPAALRVWRALGAGKVRAHNHALLLEAIALLTRAWGTHDVLGARLPLALLLCPLPCINALMMMWCRVRVFLGALSTLVRGAFDVCSPKDNSGATHPLWRETAPSHAHHAGLQLPISM